MTATRCAELTPKQADDLFFAKANAVQAKRYCMECPARITCALTAMQREAGVSILYRFGVFGGLSPVERHALDSTVP